MSSSTPAPLARRMTDYQNPNSLGSRFRARRLGPLREMIDKVFAEKGSVSILDVGGRKIYWNLLPPGYLKSKNARITLLNIPGESKGEDDDMFLHATGNACDMKEYADNQFDIVHSNSVIEHVGNWNNVRAFASEVRRVATMLFVQTPYFWFPIEPHFVSPFFHWLPRPFRESLVLRSRRGNRGGAKDLETAIRQIEEAPRLLDIRSYKLLFPDCTIARERLFLLTKSLIAIRGLQEINRVR